MITRTFFRHFADKREVIFGDDDQIPALSRRLVLEAPAGLGPMTGVKNGLPALAATAFEGRLEQMQHHKAIIDGNDGLRERELRKIQLLTEALADAFRKRGVEDLTAAVIAETSAEIVHVALGRWIGSGSQRPLADLMNDALASLARSFGDIDGAN